MRHWAKQNLACSAISGISAFKAGPERPLVDSPGDDLCVLDVLQNPVGLFPVFMIPVKTELMLHPKQDQDGADHADGQSCDVEKRKSFVSLQISQSDL
jgi:hypothetical protein